MITNRKLNLEYRSRKCERELNGQTCCLVAEPEGSTLLTQKPVTGHETEPASAQICNVDHRS